MAKLCERPGCSEVGAAEYGMVPEDLLFWIAPISSSVGDGQNVLCQRHAQTMSVPRGWTLDDRREAIPRLFMPGRFEPPDSPERTTTRRRRNARAERAEQLVIDGTGETERPDVESTDDTAPLDEVDDVAPEPWAPAFDQGDDLDGLLEVSSPLLSRAFRGAERRSS